MTSSITNQVAALSPDSFTFSHEGHLPVAWSWEAVDLWLPPYPQLELLQGLVCTWTHSLYAILLPINDNNNRKEERKRRGGGGGGEQIPIEFLPCVNFSSYICPQNHINILYYYSYFTEEASEVWKIRNLPMVTESGTVRA